MGKEATHPIDQSQNHPTEPSIDLNLPPPDRLERAGHLFTDEIKIKPITASTGAGGQNRDHNKTAAQVWINLHKSKCFTPEEKTILLTLNGVNKRGILRITSQTGRDLPTNIQAGTQLLIDRLTQALTTPPTRIPTKTPRSQKEQRKKDKKHRSLTKSNRQKPKW